MQVQKVAVYATPPAIIDAMVAERNREHVVALFALGLSGTVPVVVEIQGQRYAARGINHWQDIVTLVDLRTLARIAASIERVMDSRPIEEQTRFAQFEQEAREFFRTSPDAPPVEVPTTLEEQAETAAAMFEQMPHMPGQYL